MRTKRVASYRHAQRNPFFREPSSTQRARWIWRIGIVLLLTSGVCVLLFVPRSMYSTRYELPEGNDELTTLVRETTDAWLASKIFFLIPRSHRVFGTLESLDKALMDTERFHAVKTVRRKGVISIQYDQRITRYYALHKDVLYELDRNGRIIGAVEDVERIQLTVAGVFAQFPTLELPDSFDMTQAVTALSVEQLDVALSAIEQLRQQTLLTPTRAELTDDSTRLNIYTDAGLALYFSLDRDLDAQLYKLVVLINKQLVDLSELTYIDLRYENRLYYH
ncbi:hypothetical protein A3C17_01285 [Candidatus Uhrbacteria bacterium RIFCSPHIGHO2_02_FULL_53_13]|uniref:POTRA domain-containing protein n=1 Tax=Candidatus Uhrbacteria bacterium RIFCSPHIGHO2_02_FULL_53_13 TaxID=1802389 RepID=A0A1F7U0C6_9BACT|nr:MAG: hypothetical protein A3C17_01285 [Candidatus Uhrbacteria bacterium RIFCSPHIGHO2_02_FULL_53_13]